MIFDVKKELENMFLVESHVSENAKELKEFSESIKQVENPIRFTGKMVPVFENSVDGKKALVINLYDIFRYATSNAADEDLSIADCFDRICADNEIENTDEYVYAVSIPDGQVKFVKECCDAFCTCGECGEYTKMPTKPGELGRFMKYLKQDCINKGIQLVKEK